MKITRFFATVAVASLSMGTLFGQALNMKTLPTDTSGNNNNGTIWNDAAIEDGKLVNTGDRGALFCANTPSLNIGTGDLTIALTVTLKEKQSKYVGLVSKGTLGNKNPGYALLFNSATKKLILVIGDGTTRKFLYSSEIALNDNKPHRIAVSLNRANGTVAFAVDGKVSFVSADTLSGKNLDSKDKFSIGSWGFGYFINGSIANVQLYKKAFSNDELKGLATQ